ncbi:DsbA family protein [Streptomyces sp. NPDC087440]|uniref:DsbA family protein n=1 Tax=Streptomyces sp. NPDC087440 TaxID=3365790 RepID=UPI0037F31529
MSTNTKSAQKNKSGKTRGVLIGSGIAAAAILLGLASYSATKPKDRDAPGTVAEATGSPEDRAEAGVFPELEKLARRTEGDPLAQGKADAPVVMVEYADFKCGFCGKFARDTEPELVKKYVDNGTLRIEWRNYPILSDESDAAARASWAAGQQGRFWQFHAAAYAKDAKEKGFGEEQLKTLAREAGVKDLDKFAADAASEEAKTSVRKDKEEAYALRATATPSFLINGRPISGAQPDEVFEQAIESAAESAKSAKAKKSASGAGAAQ